MDQFIRLCRQQWHGYLFDAYPSQCLSRGQTGSCCVFPPHVIGYSTDSRPFPPANTHAPSVTTSREQAPEVSANSSDTCSDTLMLCNDQLALPIGVLQHSVICSYSSISARLIGVQSFEENPHCNSFS